KSVRRRVGTDIANPVAPAETGRTGTHPRTPGLNRCRSLFELRRVGFGHGAPESPAEWDETPGADDSVEEDRGDHGGAGAARDDEPGAHGRFDRAAAAGKDRDRGDELPERVGDDHRA